MNRSLIDESQQKAAKVAGLAYLLPLAPVMIANLAILQRLIVTGNPAETARNILAHERLFRISIACDLIYCVGVVVLITSLYVVLKPVNQNLALLAAGGRLIYAFTWVLISLNLFTALRLLSGADYLRAFGADRLQNLVRLYLSGFDQYYVGLLFYGLGATASSYLLFRSRYIPRALAAAGVITSAWCAICTFVLLIVPTFPNVVNLWWFDSPMAIFEITTSFWFLFKGLKHGIEG
jgi:hypothetical protein